MPLVGRLICVLMAWKTCTSNPKAFCNDCYVQYAHFHGTEDGAIKYDGQNPGPAFLNNAEVIAAQLYVKTIQDRLNFVKLFCFRTDYIWAKAMGYTGAQLADSEGVQVGQSEWFL